MNVLLLHPEFPPTFWSYRYALPFFSKKATLPPLGLLTVAALLPAGWNKKLTDLNVRPLSRHDLTWADLIFISAMTLQQASVASLIRRCRQAGKRIVAGGPMFASPHGRISGIDHFILNEAEVTLPLFLHDLEQGEPKPLYASPQRADLRTSPLPDYSLIDPSDYGSLILQYSRGCIFTCDFCEVPFLYGPPYQAKHSSQILAELDQLYALGWRGHLMFADDNLVADRDRLLTDLLPALKRWMSGRSHPFTFGTQASMQAADDDALLKGLVAAGFSEVFVGIESVHPASLQECRKAPNLRRDLIASIRKFQQAGLQTMGGFILGFDRDPEAIFDRIYDFIQTAPIVIANISLLNALYGTRLYDRLLREGRVLQESSYGISDGAMNLIPKMDLTVLKTGFLRLLNRLYAPEAFYARVRLFLTAAPRSKSRAPLPLAARLHILAKCIWHLGLWGRERRQFWSLILWAARHRPDQLPSAIVFSIYGRHFRKAVVPINRRFAREGIRPQPDPAHSRQRGERST